MQFLILYESRLGRVMLERKRAAAATLAQDEATCVVFGMPKEAIKWGEEDRVLRSQSAAAATLYRKESIPSGTKFVKVIESNTHGMQTVLQQC